MEQEIIPLSKMKLPIMCGLVLNAMTIIMSVDYLYNNGKYLDLIASTFVFIIIVIMIRKLNSPANNIIEKSSINRNV